MAAQKLNVGDFGDDVARLHQMLKLHGVDVSPEEQKRKFFGPATREAVGDFQKAHGLDPSCEICEETARLLAGQPAMAAIPPGVKTTPARPFVPDAGDPQPSQPTPITPTAPPANGVSSSNATSAQVSGTVVLEHGSPASGVKVRLYQRSLGGTKTLLNEGETSQRGDYAIPYSVQGLANVEVYAVGADGREVQLSETKFGAKAEERLDLIAPSAVQPLQAEFLRLTATVAAHTGGRVDALKNALERGDRRDFSNMASVTGWDAGALALASEALSLEAHTKIPADGLYAMARVGLPMNVRTLASVSKQTVASGLRRAAEAGIVDSASIDKSLQAFVEFAADYKFNNAIEGAMSSPKDFIGKARVTDADRATFAKVIQEELTEDLWETARRSGVSEAGIQKLQLQGKLAYLTFNNAELADYLATRIASDPLELIGLGYYESAQWEKALNELSGSDAGKRASLAPPAFGGRDLDERIDAYTEELARRVRQMDPHAVTVDRIATGKIAGVVERDSVGKFLKNAAAQGFRLGKTPLSAFVKANEATVWNGVPMEKRSAVMDAMRTLSSLYAVSPNDEAMGMLLAAGFTSATGIAQYDYLSFLERLKPALRGIPSVGDKKITEKIFWKAQQQSATVFNVFDGLKRLNSMSYAPGSTPADAKKRDDQIVKTREKLAGLFPTLETLFGSVDYCECDHCQSVLSPAAYLVDILYFLDPREEAWATVKGAYKARTGSEYTKRKPFDVLNDRRPDIKNIALTCENTNTELPYIDIVNEILEQLMMSDETPPAIEAYDVGESSSQDLLAEPQNILWSAYVGAGGKKGLRDLVYPVTLPFDLPLEMVRAFLKQLDAPLWRLRESLIRPTTLAPSATGRTDGWINVWYERLGLSPGEVSALTSADKWHELYGYQSPGDALKMETINGVAHPDKTSLGSAKTLARRLDITYKELVEVVRTRFINPEIENLIVLNRLGVDPNTADRYFGSGAPLSDAERTEFEAGLRAQGLQADDLRPLRSEAVRKATVVLRSPSVGCDFAKTTLAFDQNPDDVESAMAMILLKMNVFVRLQKKLGWDIHELDRALMALMPGVSSLTMATWPEAMMTALIYLAHVDELRERLQYRLSREEILILWSDIPTKGVSCLYDRMFLSPAVLGRDPAFAKTLGGALDSTAQLADRADGIRQALQLSHDEIEPILVAGGATDRTLSIKNISILARHAALARGLELSIAELLALLSLSERKPLSSLDAAPLADLAKDVPWTETLAFVREVETLREAGVDIGFVERMCRHRGVIEEPAADKDPALIAILALKPDSPAVPEKQQIILVQTLAAQLSAPEALVDKLLGTVLKDAGGGALKETGFGDPARAAESLRKLRKALDLVQTLGITDAEIGYMTQNPAALNPNDLPITEVASQAAAQTLKKGLMIWLELVAARKQFGRSERLLAVLSAAKQPIDAANTFAIREKSLHDALAALTGRKAAWLAQALDAIGAKSSGGAMFEVSALADPARLRRTVDSLKLLVRLGLNPAEVVQIASEPIDERIAQKVRSSVKSRYTPSAWRRLVKPIFDSLRKLQRDALTAHLTRVMDGDVPRYGDTVEKLFEYLASLNSGSRGSGNPMTVFPKLSLPN